MKVRFEMTEQKIEEKMRNLMLKFDKLNAKLDMLESKEELDEGDDYLLELLYVESDRLHKQYNKLQSQLFDLTGEVRLI